MVTKPKTFADLMRAEAREIDGQSWVFGISFVTSGLEEQVIEGMKAFAQLWFVHYTDEKELPSEFYRMKDILDDILLDTSELEDEEDEDEEDGEEG